VFIITRVFTRRYPIRLCLRPVPVPMVCWLIAGLVGCGPSSELHVVQLQLDGFQRHMRLMSEQVFWATGEKVDRVLAEFPLPGATTGRPTFLLYLRLPAGESEPTVCAQVGETARGFFIQTRGVFAGLAGIVSGKIRVHGTSKAKRAIRRITFELACEEGTRLEGCILARRDDYVINHFETRRRPVDIQNLIASPPKPTTSKGP